MKSFEEDWKCVEAIQYLFFEEASAPSTTELERAVRDAFSNNNISSTGLTVDERRVVKAAVDAVHRAMPTMKPYGSLHPVLWMRWALRRTAIPIARTCLLGFSAWRAKRKPWAVMLMLYWNADTDKWRGKARSVEGVGKLVGFTIDQVLSQESFSFDEFGQRWKTQKIRFETLANKKRESTPKTIEQVCGKDQLRILGECVRAEARCGTLGLLSKRKKEGKYVCSGTRPLFIQRIRESYPELGQWEAATLQRGVSKFVSFKRGRPFTPR